MTAPARLAAVAGCAATLARQVPLLHEDLSVLEAWRLIDADPDGLGLVVRGHRPLAVVDRGLLAEWWPAGGPRRLTATTLRDVLPPMFGLEGLAADDDVDRVARAVLTSRLPGLPVWSPTGWVDGVVTPRAVLAAVLAVASDGA
jgi:hypothetical protein